MKCCPNDSFTLLRQSIFMGAKQNIIFYRNNALHD